MTIPVYAIGATALTGGTDGCLDAAFVDAVGDDPGIADGYVAFVPVQGDAMYHYIADADSGATVDGVNVIVPLYQSAGVPYTGDLRWILHDCYTSETVDSNLHYVPLSMSEDYTIPTNQVFVGGDEFEMTGDYSLIIEGTGRMILS